MIPFAFIMSMGSRRGGIWFPKLECFAYFGRKRHPMENTKLNAFLGGWAGDGAQTSCAQIISGHGCPFFFCLKRIPKSDILTRISVQSFNLAIILQNTLKTEQHTPMGTKITFHESYLCISPKCLHIVIVFEKFPLYYI